MNVILSDKRSIRCKPELFAQGGDGEVYLSHDGRWVIKLYHKAEEWRRPTLEAILNRFNVVRGVPYWADLLCWPEGIVTQPRLGVVMPRAAKGLRPLERMIRVKWLSLHPEDVGSWDGRARAALKLARAIHRLHHRGICHSDLSPNNVFVDPSEGRALVIDCDGLVVPDLARPVVVGTARTMAPELVSGAAADPSIDSDLHALAVLIYQLLLIRHPLEGPQQHDPDPEIDDRLAFGERALYIEHPTDGANRPPRLNWTSDQLGPEVSGLMRQAFVDGLHNPALRPLASDWERELRHMLDRMVICLNPGCPLKSFPLPDLAAEQPAASCPWCNHPLRGLTVAVLAWLSPVADLPGVFQRDGTCKVAWHGQTLHTWHMQPHFRPGPRADTTPLARFIHVIAGDGAQHWYLQNDRIAQLFAADPGGIWRRVGLGQTVELRHGRKLRFGQGRDATVELFRLV